MSKNAKKQESSSEEEYETYEYETESSEEKPAAKKADAKPAAAAAAKADSKKDEKKKAESSSEESSEYEYETETESEEKKPAAKADAKPAAAAAAAAAKPAAADAKKADAKPAAKKDESSSEYEYESEYETESEEKKPAAKPAAATTTAAAAKAAPATTSTTTTSSTTTTTTAVKAAPVAAVAVVVRQAPSYEANPWAPKNFLAEFVGTFLFTFATYMVRASVKPTVNLDGTRDALGGLESLALVQALGIALFTAAFVNISGAHFNPAVTLFLLFTRQFNVVVGLVYIIVQFAAAILAAALTWGLLPPTLLATIDGTGFSAPIACGIYPLTSADAAASCWHVAFGAEIVGTLLFLVLYGMIITSGHGEVPYLSLGFGLGALVFAFQGTSNAFFNPARALGSAVFASAYAWDNIWVWLIGPILGALAAALVWGLVFQTKEDKSKGSSLLSH